MLAVGDLIRAVSGVRITHVYPACAVRGQHAPNLAEHADKRAHVLVEGLLEAELAGYAVVAEPPCSPVGRTRNDAIN